MKSLVLVLVAVAAAYTGFPSYSYAQPSGEQIHLPTADHPLEAAVVQALESAGQRELGQRAVELFRSGKYAEALRLAQRGLELTEKSLGPDHPTVATILIGIGVVYESMGAFTQAEPLLLRALEIKEKALGPDDPQVAMALSNLAILYRDMGAYAKAKPLLTRALRISENAFGPEHLQVATDLSSLALLYQDMGDYSQALLLNQRVLPIMEKAYGPQHHYFASALNNLAWTYEDIGAYAKANPLYQRALAILENSVGPEHPYVALVLNNLANIAAAQGDYAEAVRLRQRALAIREKVLGPDHPAVATSLYGLASLYRTIGDNEKAIPLYLRTMAIRTKALGPGHPDILTTFNDVALLHQDFGEYTKAALLLQQVLVVREKTLGPEHPDVANALNNLAGVYVDMGDYAKAEPLHQWALAIRAKALGPEHPQVAQSLNNLAFLYQATGDYAKAEQLYRHALAIYEKALGPKHPSVASSLSNLAFLVAAQQNYRSASGLFQKVFLVQEEQIQNIFAFTTEEQKLLFVESLRGNYFAFLSLVHQHLSTEQWIVRSGLELVLRRKGIVFDAQSRAREALQGRMPEAARKEWDQLSALRGNFARLSLNKPDKISPEAYRGTLALLQRQIEAVEQRLANESALVAQELKQRTVTVEAVARALPEHSALVEFVKIQDRDFAKGKFVPVERYLAFVLTAEGDVTLVDLGEASALEAAARRVLTEIRVSLETRGIQVLKEPGAITPKQENLKSLADLYAQLWAPLKKFLTGVDKIVVSPDGLLNLVPFAALVDGEGRFLLERYRLAYVSSGRELIGAAGSLINPDSDLLLVANPAFGKKVQGAGSTVVSVRSRDFRGTFDPLPGTEREAKEIPPLVSDSGGKKSVLVESNATEGAVKYARSPRILHLATHGFFLQDEEIDLCGRMRGVTVVKNEKSEEKTLCEKTRGVTVVKKENPGPAKRHENPLVRSGLAFAGANKASEITEGDDGILTALEITGMDLYGTELVVLSACDTGVGEIKTGEGVFGLRRAFALAGAKNLLMSLWPVSDEITANQMKAFYQNLQKLPPAEALRQAQLATIKELKGKDGIASPTLWAPFFLQGAHALGQ